ncbi:hypothetical protein FISHEDRAFT_52985 [Fistulina hepatica ATCC 64428]|nr:hypothetical protein FISHEDRAFT_52985 [Fistulina hepatica ATCC 64428]
MATASLSEITEIIDSDVDEVPDFDEAEVIGKGLTYPREVPAQLDRAKTEKLKMPDAFKNAALPADDLPVSQFLELALPPQSQTSIVLVKAKSWYSNDEPNVNPLKLLMARPIPHKKVLEGLKQSFGQAWFDGKKSISDPRYNNGEDKLPFYVLTFWERMAATEELQRRWKYHAKWLRKQAHQCTGSVLKAIYRAKDILDSLGHNSTSPFLIQLAARTPTLMSFLGESWFSGELIDMMMADFSIRVSAHCDLKDKVVIASLAFANEIASTKTSDYSSSKLLCCYAQLLAEGTIERLYFPVHVRQNHWIAACINLKTKIVTYGDSLSSISGPPARFIKSLKRWLACAPLCCDVEIIKDGLEHGLQTDGFNCGPCTANTIEHAIFPDVPLWCPERTVETRIRLFNRFAAACLEQANAEMEGTDSLGGIWRSSGDIDNSVIRVAAPAATADMDTILRAPAHESTEASTTYSSSSLVHVESTESIAPMDVNVKDELADSMVPMADSMFSLHTTPTLAAQRLASFAYSASPMPSKPSAPSAAAAATLNKSTCNHTATYEREKRSAIKEGRYTPTDADLAKISAWQEYVHRYDPHAQFDDENPLRVCHSVCDTWVTVKYIGDISRWDDHMKPQNPGDPCSKQKKPQNGPTLHTQTLSGMKYFTKKAPICRSSKCKPPEYVERPCPGITPTVDPHVNKYLHRTSETGGGGESLTKHAFRIFHRAYRRLRIEQKEEVMMAQRHGRKWQNEHSRMRVFASNCLKKVEVLTDEPTDGKPCDACRAILRSKEFQNALRRDPPKKKKNWRYINKRFLNSVAAEIHARSKDLYTIFSQADAKNTPCIIYAQAALEGSIKNTLFASLMDALCSVHEREERGVGMQNFRWPVEWDEFMHIVQIQAPSAAELIGKHLPKRTERSYKHIQAKVPRLPLDICLETFQRVHDQLEAMGCLGDPMCLSVDDTKLFAQLRMYYDDKAKKYFVVGGEDGPIQVADPAQLEALLRDDTIKPSTKMRLFVAMLAEKVKSPPTIVAALPLPSKVDAEFLCDWSMKVIIGLIENGAHIIAYGCDGTEVERAVQKLLLAHHECTPVERVITSPKPGLFANTRVTYMCIHGQNIALVQDSKHALKTYRNNIYSGARCLVLGDFPVLYQHIRNVAHDEESPLYHRDVDKVDRQDDNAARRLFSAKNLEYIVHHRPDYVGELVFLFVFGELIDAYQSRSINHFERVKMVLRARYFVDAWISALAISKYPMRQYCLSREALDITRIIIEGYLSLLFIYRDDLSKDGFHPLLAWLNSSEACEHTFAEARKNFPDFALLDFLYLVPKITIAIRHAIFSTKITPDDVKARATGYTHTYFDDAGIDLLALATFPNNEQIDELAYAAMQEVESLLSAIGINSAHLVRMQDLIKAQYPSLQEWYPDKNCADPLFSEQDFGSLDDEEWVPENECDIGQGQALQALLDLNEQYEQDHAAAPRSLEDEEEATTLTVASLAVMVDEMSTLHNNIADVATTEQDMFRAQKAYCQAIQHEWLRAARSIPDVRLDTATTTFGQGSLSFTALDMQELVTIRFEHQTRHATDSIHTKQNIYRESAATSARREIIKRFEKILKNDNTRAGGTGLLRINRWTTQPGYSSSGNAANAKVVAHANAKEVCRQNFLTSKAIEDVY